MRKEPRQIATRTLCGECGAEVTHSVMDFTKDGQARFEPCGHDAATTVLKVEMIGPIGVVE